MSNTVHARGAYLPHLIFGLIKCQRVLCEVVVLAMAILVAIEVICRSWLGFSLLIVEEMGGYMLVALVFLGMGVALHDGALFRVEFVLNVLPARLRLWLQCLFDVICLVAMVIVSWQLGKQAYESYTRGAQAATTLGTPLYLPQIFMVLGAFSVVLILLSQIMQGVINIRGERHE